MARRRAQILEAARRLITEQGYDALVTRVLAKAAGVTQPTLYNLIGPKEEIIKALLLEAADRITSHARAIRCDDVIDWTTNVLTRAVDVFAEDERYYRAAVIAGDRNADLFAAPEEGEPVSPPMIGAQAAELYNQICSVQIESGQLQGNIKPTEYVSALWGAFRVNLRDWAYGLITLAEFQNRVLGSHYLVLAADAEPGLRRRLLERHKALRTQVFTASKPSASGTTTA